MSRGLLARGVLLGATWAVMATALAQQPPAAAPASPAVTAAPAAAPVVAPAPSIEAGRRAYTSTCARCHGIGLVVTSSAYYDLRGFPKEEKARFIDSVNNGKRQMPAWGSLLKPETVESLWLYVGSVNGW